MAILLFSFSLLTILSLGVALFSGDEGVNRPQGSVLSATDEEVVDDIEDGEDPTINESIDDTELSDDEDETK